VLTTPPRNSMECGIFSSDKRWRLCARTGVASQEASQEQAPEKGRGPRKARPFVRHDGCEASMDEVSDPVPLRPPQPSKAAGHVMVCNIFAACILWHPKWSI